MALHGELKVNGGVIGRWYAQRVLTRESGFHQYRWETYDEQGRHRTGSINHWEDEGAGVLAAKVLLRSAGTKYDGGESDA